MGESDKDILKKKGKRLAPRDKGGKERLATGCRACTPGG